MRQHQRRDLGHVHARLRRREQRRPFRRHGHRHDGCSQSGISRDVDRHGRHEPRAGEHHAADDHRNPANGQTLSAVDGQWTGATPITFSYLWQLCDSTGAGCLPITGATAKTYLLTSSAVGKTLRVQVTAANSNGTRASTSVPTAVVSSTPTTLVKLANGVTSIDASEVALPARLILSKFRVQQSQPLHTRAPFRVTFTVTDTRGYVVRNALVYLIGLPYNRIQTVPEQKTGQDGTATFTLTPTSLQPLKVGARLVIFGRARVEGDSLLAGASTRRLVEVVFGAPR